MGHFIKKTLSSVYGAWRMITNQDFALLKRELSKRFYSTTVTLGLKRNLEMEFEHPDAKIPILVRKLKTSDVVHLMGNGDLEENDFKLYKYQMGVIEAGIPDGYVAVTGTETPCYMQFLIRGISWESSVIILGRRGKYSNKS